MSRLILVPQYPTKLRYQEWFYYDLPLKLSKYFDEVLILGSSYIDMKKETSLGKLLLNSVDHGLFSSQREATIFENYQIQHYLNLDMDVDNDVLLLMDLSYPGYFSNVLYHKPIKNAYCYCHATAKNNFDLFPKEKFLAETAHAKLYKKIFVGSEYHKRKLGWDNVEVVGLPFPPFETFREKKENEIISVSRPNKQKVTKYLEKLVEKDFSPIIRKKVETWEQYYKFLSSAKVLLITTKEETFGYSAMEAIMNGTIVIAPNNFSYPELLEDEFLYDNYDDLSLKLWASLNGDLKVPDKLVCNDLCVNFYENISKIMKGEKNERF